MNIPEIRKPDTRQDLVTLSMASRFRQACSRRSRSEASTAHPESRSNISTLAKRYVLRGVESGGAVSDLGRACAFVAEDGAPLPWLQRLNSIAVNGRHAIFLAESMVRLEMLRSLQSCELAITLHTLLRLCPGVNVQRFLRDYCFADAMACSVSIFGSRNTRHSRES